MLVELKNGETYNGHLVNCDTWMNIHLREVICTSKDGDRFWRMPECYIRGNTIKYLRVPDEVIFFCVCVYISLAWSSFFFVPLSLEWWCLAKSDMCSKRHFSVEPCSADGVPLVVVRLRRYHREWLLLTRMLTHFYGLCCVVFLMRFFSIVSTLFHSL